MSTNPLILDAQTLKRLPMPNVSGQQMPSAVPNMPLQAPSVLSNVQASQNLQRLPVPDMSSLPPMTSATPSVPSPVMPTATLDPAIQNTRTRLLGDQNNYNRMLLGGSGTQQLLHPVDASGNPTNEPIGTGRRIGGILARIGDVAGSILAPGVAAAIPGTTNHHDFLLNQGAGRINNDLRNQQEQAQTEGFNLQNAAEPLHNQLTQAQTDLANAQATRAKIPIAPTIKYSVAGLPESVDDGHGHLYLPTDQNMPPQIKQMFDVANANYQTNLNKTVKPMTAEHAASMNQLWNPIAQKHGLPLNQFTPGMSAAEAAQLASGFNNVIGRGQGDQHISISLEGMQDRHDRNTANNSLDTSDPAMRASVAAVADGSMKLQDVFGRGATTALKAQFVAAVKQVNPNYNSGDHDIENRVRQYMTSGQGGSTLTAGNTLTHHLDLYDKAADAVHNGDIKLLNQIGNELGVQLGSDAQTNLSLIRRAVAFEAARFYTGGVPGETEIEGFMKDLSGDGSLQAMHGGANIVRALAHGKLQGLKEQATAGSQGQPNFGGENQTSNGSYKQTATGSNGHKIGSNDGGSTWFDVKTGKAVQ